MNHVAHCFLSFPDDEVLLGNFIGDFVKGKAWQDFPPQVQKGILLHRAIDSFTDNHPMARASAGRIRDFAGRYSAPVTDILYDYLLIRNWNMYAADTPFDNFAAWAYQSLDKNEGAMPEVLRRRWPQMRDGRFLHGYGSREGLDWVLHQFAGRLNGHLDAGALSAYFFSEIPLFSTDFNVFFPDLAAFVRLRLSA